MINQEAIRKIIPLMEAADLDALLVAPSEDMVYLAGCKPWLCERFQGLFIKKNGECFYIVNLLSGGEVRQLLGGGIRIYTWWDGEDFAQAVKKILEREGLIGKVIGTNIAVRASNVLHIQEQVNVVFKDARALINEARICKEPEELDCLRKAAQIADASIEDAWKLICPGMTENGVRQIMKKCIAENGGETGDAIVCFGPNASFPHYMPQGEGAILQEKDIMLIDFGCSYKGYQADMTRTVFFGEPTEEERSIYGIVLESNRMGEEAVAEGAYIPDIDKAARKVIEDAGYGEFFTTRLGHGIGCQPHEEPDIKQSNQRNLKRGMAFSIEPGIYIPEVLGVRIEDIVIVNENGEREVLNKVSKELKVF